MMNVRRGIALLLVLLLTGCTESAPDQPGGDLPRGSIRAQVRAMVAPSRWRWRYPPTASRR